MRKSNVLLRAFIVCGIGLLNQDVSAQLALKVGVDVFGSHRLKSDFPIKVTEAGLRGSVLVDNTVDANLGLMSALELMAGSNWFKIGASIEYQHPRELQDINGNFGFLSLYSVTKIALPVPFRPYLTGRVGINILRGDANYKSTRYAGVSPVQLGNSITFRHGFGYGFGAGFPISRRYFVEAIYTVSKSTREYIRWRSRIGSRHCPNLSGLLESDLHNRLFLIIISLHDPEYQMKSSIVMTTIAILSMIGCKNPGDSVPDPLNEGPLMYYPFSGNANDQGKHGFHGEVIGATLGEDRFGNANSAFDFDGVDDYIELQSRDLDPEGSFTISLWAKGLACVTCGDDEAGLFSVASLNPYGLGIDSSGRLLFRVVASQRPFSVEETETMIDPNQWYHYAAIFRAGQSLQLFIDGVEVGRNSTNIPVVLERATEKLWIGGRSSGRLAIRPQFFFDGLIDEVRVYSRALSAAEVNQLHAAEQ